MYEYTLQNATGVATPAEIVPVETCTLVDNQPKELSELELKKAMRDFKRRRQAYRTKVSTKSKSQTQVTREIIHNMMVFLGAEDMEHESLQASAYCAVPADRPECDSSQHGSQDIKNTTSKSGFFHEKQYISNDISRRKGKKEYNKDYETKLRWREKREQDDDDRSKDRRKLYWEHEIDSHRKNQTESEKEYRKVVKRSSRKDNRKMRDDAEYYKTDHRRYEYESRSESEEKNMERSHDGTLYRYEDHKRIRMDGGKHKYKRFHDEVTSKRRKENTAMSDKLHGKSRKPKEVEGTCGGIDEDYLKCIKKIQEGNRWEEKLRRKESFTEDGEISSEETDSTCSTKDYRSSARHRKKQILKREKVKGEQKKKQKYKIHRHHQSESEESADNNSDVRLGRKGKTNTYIHEESVVY